MKKLIALVLAVVMTAALLCVPAMAETYVTESVKVVMSTKPVKITYVNYKEKISDQQMKEAIEAAIEQGNVIPEDCEVNPERMTIKAQKRIICEQNPFYATFKVWGMHERANCLFYHADGEEEWKLLCCNKGDILEALLPADGIFVIAAAW